MPGFYVNIQRSLWHWQLGAGLVPVYINSYGVRSVSSAESSHPLKIRINKYRKHGWAILVIKRWASSCQNQLKMIVIKCFGLFLLLALSHKWIIGDTVFFSYIRGPWSSVDTFKNQRSYKEVSLTHELVVWQWNL